MKTERKITTPNALNFPIVYTTTKNKRRVSFRLWGFPVYLSRACVGKMFVFIYKAKKDRLNAPSWDQQEVLEEYSEPKPPPVNRGG